MSIRRPPPILTSLLARPVSRTFVRPQPFFALSNHHRFYSQGYGDGKGDPKAENLQDQGPNPQVNKEHPGPPPPDVGQSKGETSSEGKKPKVASSSGGVGEGGGTGSPSNGAQPKILDERGGPGELSEEAKQHNREMEDRYDHPLERDTSGKVGKDYWKG
jgi:hypothetical protein